MAVGVSNTGGIRVTGSPTNRVVIKSYVTVRSLLGPEETIIEVTWSSDGNTNGTDAARCRYAYQFRLIGFTWHPAAPMRNRARIW